MNGDRSYYGRALLKSFYGLSRMVLEQAFIDAQSISFLDDIEDFVDSGLLELYADASKLDTGIVTKELRSQCRKTLDLFGKVNLNKCPLLLDKLRNYRTTSGCLRYELSEKTGILARRIYEIETAQDRATEAEARRLAPYYHCSWREIFAHPEYSQAERRCSVPKRNNNIAIKLLGREGPEVETVYSTALDKVMKARDITAAQLATRLKISTKTVKRIMKGEFTKELEFAKVIDFLKEELPPLDYGLVWKEFVKLLVPNTQETVVKVEEQGYTSSEYNYLPRDFGSRLVTMMAKSNTTIDSLASSLDISIKTISTWRTGSRVPSESYIEGYAKKLSRILGNNGCGDDFWIQPVLRARL